MQDKIPDALIAAFVRHYSLDWNDPAMRNERLAWRAAWVEATKPCLHQIQEPAAAEQAAWHAGLDEGRAQATGSVSNATSQAVPDDRAAFERELIDNHHYVPSDFSFKDGFYNGDDDYIQFGWDVWKARSALAATPAAASPAGWKLVPIEPTAEMLESAGATDRDGTPATYKTLHMAMVGASPAAAPVVLPEPMHREWRFAFQKAIDTMAIEADVRPDEEDQRQMRRAIAILRALLAQKLAIMPKGESAAAQLRAMATNYPTGHSWDKLDAKACIRGALEIEALRALLATATGLPAQPIAYLRAAATLPEYGGLQIWKNDGTAFPVFAAPQAQADAREADGMYYMQDARWTAMVGNCPSFWRSGGGYTTNLDDAERFTLAAAMKQHKCRETDLPWLCSELDTLRRPTIDCQYMPRSWDDQRAAIATQASQQADEA